MKKSLLLGMSLGIFTVAYAQQPSSEADIKKGFSEQTAIENNSLFKTFPARSVGPVFMSGRVSDFAVTSNPKKFYAGFASAGVFVTNNYGASFEPIFDGNDALGIGDIALAPSNENVLYVGTGEKNSSRSSYAGSGVYRTTDAGKTWEFLGLSNTQHIGRIVVHPKDQNTVWVGAMGPLYSYGGERGVYKSTDGGKNWKRTLYVNDSTGVIDLVIHPTNPNILWASTWQRYRQAWNFDGSGNGSGIWKSTDGGETWAHVKSGLPSGRFVGRIGLDVSNTNPDVLYALIDNLEETKTDIKKDKDKLYFDDFENMSSADIQKLDSKKLESFLRSNDFPQKYTAEIVKKEIAAGKYEGKAIANYAGDANAALFNTTVKGAEVYKSSNGGETWEKVNSYNLDGVYYTYGYYFGEIRINPSNENDVYILGVPILKSADGGKTWKRIDHSGVHVDHQAFWIDPNDGDHILLGNDGGIYSSFDGGTNWTHHNTVPVGQFYTVMVDNEKPYNIYGGLQDNGVNVGSSKTVPNKGEGWKSLLGGDGMHVAVHPQNSNIVYAGYQFGNYYRIDRKKNDYTFITPKHDIGTDTYRFNWNTPVVLSAHNPDVVYMGSQKVMRSMNRGDDFVEISPDLTTNYKPQGNVPYSTLTQISESPFQFGLIWAGTDDGNIQVTENGGVTWVNVNSGLPKNMWVSKLVASPHDRNSAYVTLTGYRFDHFESYAYMTSDLGKTWTALDGGLPTQAVNVLIPDTENPNLLFAGTDHGGFMSFDAGKNWQQMPNTIPNVAVYDLMVHPRDGELVVATHGRSVYVFDVKPLRELLKKGLNEAVYVFEPSAVMYSNRWGTQRNPYDAVFKPSASVNYFVKEASKLEVKLGDGKKKVFKTWKLDTVAGYNELSWDLVLSEKDGKAEFLGVGKYTLTFKVGKTEVSVPFEVKERGR
ncbi:glycosyl hydrolase [bacterium]|nr:MAG: glycosyl hydrolase [bacterium]